MLFRSMNRQALQDAIAMQQLSSIGQAEAMGQQGAYMLGQGLGSAFGIEDPALKRESTRYSLARQFDVNSPEGLAQYAKALQQVGDIQGALQVANLSNQIAGQVAETKLAQQKLASATISGEREQQLQSALSQLPEDASEQQIQGVLRRYGDPKTVLQALERKNNLDAQLAERRRMQEDQNQFRRDLMEKDQDFKRELARLQADLKAGTTSLQQQLIQEKIDALRQKKQDTIDKQLASAEGIVSVTDVVLGKIDEAEKLISGRTTGVGSYLSVIPGTNARELSTALATIKSRLGFDQLQQMRNSNPTGGALGQVAVKELEALQSAIASLDQGLSPDALRQNLKQIRDSYSRWREAALGKLPVDRREQMQTPAQTGVIDFNSLK